MLRRRAADTPVRLRAACVVGARVCTCLRLGPGGVEVICVRYHVAYEVDGGLPELAQSRPYAESRAQRPEDVLLAAAAGVVQAVVPSGDVNHAEPVHASLVSRRLGQPSVQVDHVRRLPPPQQCCSG